ncbi:MAG: RNA methyltransferase, partial [Leptospira sp.]|nr:RNA methyltransferase [Leptospira sp.]
MNLLILKNSDQSDLNKFKLNDRRAVHIIQILKSKPGDVLRAGILNESKGNFTVTDIDANTNIVSGIYTQDQSTKVRDESTFNEIHIISALQRPQTVKKILQICATIGVEKITFFVSDKSEKSYLNSPVWMEENIEKEIILGLEQGKKVHAPHVTLLKSKSMIPDYISEPVRFILDPEGDSFWGSSELIQNNGSICILLGPEPGFTTGDKKIF